MMTSMRSEGMPDFEYTFPAIRGIQAGREYYVSMCPLRLIPKIFLFDEEELRPELRAQRSLNRSRVPEIARYMLDRPRGYTFSSITASIDGKVKIEPAEVPTGDRNVGRIRIPMNARFVINDGQHRRAAIEMAVAENADLCDETISVVFYIDVGLKRCQQMFADLNRYAVRPTTSLSLLYDHSDEDAQVAKVVMTKVPVFAELTETEKSKISNRSFRLFTLSGIYHGTKTLLAAHGKDSFEAKVAMAAEYWQEVARHVPDWELARQRKVTAAELRQEYIHAHTLALAALGRVGAALIGQPSKAWKMRLQRLSTVNWSRSNADMWQGRAMNAGRLSKRTVNVVLTANVLKRHLGLELSPEEKSLESDFAGGKRNAAAR